MHRLIIFLLLLNVISSCGSEKASALFQNDIYYDRCYYEEAELARKEFYQSKFDVSYQIFSAIFENNPQPLMKDAVIMAINCIVVGKEKEASEYVVKSVLSGAEYSDFLEVFEGVNVDVSLFSNYEYLIDINHVEYINNLNKGMADSIRVLLSLDSLSRINGNNEMIIKNDKLIKTRLKYLLIKNGIPSSREISAEDQLKLYALVLHAVYYKDDSKFFFEVLDELLLQGVVSLKLYKYAIARSRIVQEVRQERGYLSPTEKGEVIDSLMRVTDFNSSAYESSNFKYINCKI